MKFYKRKECKTIAELIEAVSEEINGILRANIYEISLKEEALKELKERKGELRSALRNCGIGDDSA